MRTRWIVGVMVCVVGQGSGCGPSGDNGDGGPDAQSDTPPSDAADSGKQVLLSGPSKGSSIAISPDGKVALVANRDVGSVSVLTLAPADSGVLPAPAKVAELAVGNEPWQVVISPDSSTGYVVLRKDQAVVQINGLETSPSIGKSAVVGSEPTGIAMTPTGASLWVANWVDGTVSVIDSAAMTVKSTIDLNAPLVATGRLGTLTARPALAHPRSIAITNGGQGIDTDESVYVTEYFGQATAPEASDGSNADTRKVGMVYKIKIADSSVTTIDLAPIADMGFQDQNGGKAGCYPNQLQSITLNSHFAYVVSVCASPRGPTGPLVTTTPCTTAATCTGLVDPVCVQPSATSAGSVCVDVASTKTTTAPLVSVIDTSTDAELVTGTVSLNKAFRDLYTSASTPDSNARRYPLFANDMVFVPGANVGYVSANGADAVFRVTFDNATGAFATVGSTIAPFIDLNPAAINPASAGGLNPTGLVMAPAGNYMLTANDISRNMSVVDLTTQGVAGGPTAPNVVSLTAPATGSELTVVKGRRFFNTGTGRWSLKGQGWGACQSCHGDGLTDAVTWYFARGPRQSTSLDGTFNKSDPTDQRALNWGAINDELADFEGNVRGVSGGVGAIVTTDSTPPATTDRIDVTTACATGVNPACTNGNGNIGLNGSAAEAGDPANKLALNPAPSSADTEWAAVNAYVQTIRSPRAPTNLDSTKVSAGAALFAADGNCVGCHSGPKWTISKVFYAPAAIDSTTGLELNQSLFTTQWGALNGLPASVLPSTAGAGAPGQVMRFAGTSAAAFDQLLCELRNVGTFGVAETAAGIAELRIDMKTAAQGAGNRLGHGPRGHRLQRTVALRSLRRRAVLSCRQRANPRGALPHARWERGSAVSGTPPRARAEPSSTDSDPDGRANEGRPNRRVPALD